MIGHNPKAPQSPQRDDIQDLLALLKDLPQVSAPANFNASLQARLARAKAEAHEFADVTSLLKELPRVAAPSDFDFRLRARIAQAKSQQEKPTTGWFAELFGRTFSWAQAGVGMAAVAVVVSIAAFSVLRSGQEAKPVETNVAAVNPTPQASTPSAFTTTETPTPKVPSAVQINTAQNTVEPTRRVIRTIQPTGPKPSAPINANAQPAPVTPRATETDLAATKTIIIKHRSGEARVVNLSEYNLGLQTASLRATPAKANVKAESAFAANIY